MKIKHISLLVLSTAGFLASCANNQDSNMLQKINNVLAEVEASNKLTCQDAINAVVAKDATLDPTTYTFNDKERCFAYDIDAQQFIILKNDKVLYAPNGYQMNYSLSVFKFTDIYSANTYFSQYLTEAYPGSDTLVVTTGLDMGNHHDIHNIYYENYGEAKRVSLRTSCDYLNINAPEDEVTHFNVSNNVFVTAAETYHEYGTSAYTKASQGLIMFEPYSSTDMFEIPTECRDVVTTKTHKNALVYAQINADEVPATALKLKEVTQASDLDDHNYNFYRLVNNVTFDDNKYWNVVGSVCLDLNGHRLSFHNVDNATKVEDMHPAILVDALNKTQDVNCYILDTRNQLFESSGIYTLDCALVARGGPAANANLVMNGGKVTATRDYYGHPAIISVGQYSNPDLPGYKSNLVMYGGKVVIKDAETIHRSTGGLKCLQPKGSGATLTMVYGNLESDGFCISGMGSKSDVYGNTTISITGGTFKSGLGGPDGHETGNDSYPVLFFPQGGIVNIYGGTFIGPSCLTAKSGTVNVHGGTYIASREYPEKGDYADHDGFKSDGSAICIDVSDKHYIGDAHINVSGNAKMTSKHAYIAHIRAEEDQTQEPSTYPASITINEGTFTYHLDKSKTYDDNHPITINGGTWTQA